MKEITLPSGSTLRFIDDLLSDGERDHRYELVTEDRTLAVPGIHEVMVRYEVCEPPNDHMKPWMELGTRVHTATELDDCGEFDEECGWAKSGEIAYLHGWRKFKAEHPEFGPPLKVEGLVGSDEAMIATVVDRIYDGGKVLQVKTGNPNAKVHAVQLALEGLLALPSAAFVERWAVYLDGDGEYDLKQYVDNESMDAALDIFRCRRSIRKYMTTRRKPTRSVKV